MKPHILTLLVNLTFVALVFSQTNTTTGSTGGPTTPPATTKAGTSSTPKPSQSTSGTSTAPTPTSTLSPKEECPKHNASCDDCIGANTKCVFCYGDQGNTCFEYPLGDILPNKKCPLSKARWGVCWVNFEALIIAMSVIGGVIILTITICCIRCCCCRGGDSKKYLKDEAKWERQKTERKQRSEERRADRKERMDEIRRKYGLVKDDTPYQRFDA